MIRIAALTVALLAAGAANAASVPSRFDHEPTIPYRIVRSPPENIKTFCRDKRQITGCSWVTGGICYITLTTKMPKGWYAGVLRHEKAHCNGWAPSHPR